ncbi:MAG: response regulator transcription factor [Bacteroidetes bacterium]|nr:response regulator transcription factor [Bacteroidota bacterium]
MKKIQILLVEDNRLLRDGISAILKKQPDMHVVAEVGNGEKILDVIKNHKPDIILLDLGLRGQNSLQLVNSIKKSYQGINIIVMDLIPNQNDIYDFIKAGASGFLLKDASVSEFYKTIRAVYQGGQFLPPQLTGSLFTQIIDHAVSQSKPSFIEKSVRMTKRENQVITLISDGLTNKEIAQKLRLSPYTVKSHVHNILEKLALTTRVQIAKYVHLSENYKISADDSSQNPE